MTMLSTTPRYAAPTIRRGVAIFLARVDRLVNRWISGVIAHRERHANLLARRRLSDQDLKDMGIRRCEIDNALAEAVPARQRVRRSERF